MDSLKLHKVAYLLVLVGAINWLFAGLFGVDLVSLIFSAMPILARLIFLIVGLAGVYLIYIDWKAKTLW